MTKTLTCSIENGERVRFRSKGAKRAQNTKNYTQLHRGQWMLNGGCREHTLTHVVLEMSYLILNGFGTGLSRIICSTYGHTGALYVLLNTRTSDFCQYQVGSETRKCVVSDCTVTDAKGEEVAKVKFNEQCALSDIFEYFVWLTHVITSRIFEDNRGNEETALTNILVGK